jgi:RHS repeat-associated protein
VDRRGVSIDFAYDILDRRTSVVYGAESSVQFFYDAVGRVTNINDSIAGNIGLTYDSLDRLTQETNVNGVINYKYNDVGLRTNMQITGQAAVTYRYDSANRLTNVVQTTDNVKLFYDDAGRRTNLNLPQGIKVAYRYDNASRLTNITYYAAVTNKIDYAYDATGNRVGQASLLAVYNLPSAVSTGTYNAANQQLTFGSYTMLYDANGNVTNIISGTTTNRLLWNSRNQLTNVVAAVSGSFVYDGLGRRRQRVVSGNTENYLYDGLDVILQKTAAGAVGARYLRGLAIDEPWQRTDIGAANTNRVYLVDALGSIVALADTNKVIQTEYDYEPFGNTTTTGSANKNAYKFTAREDDGTGLYYYRARFYHPVLGRFVSEDALEFSGGDVNLYGYVGLDPLNSTDPFGLQSVREAIDQIKANPELANDPLVKSLIDMWDRMGKFPHPFGRFLCRAAGGDPVTPWEMARVPLEMGAMTGPGLTPPIVSPRLPLAGVRQVSRVAAAMQGSPVDMFPINTTTTVVNQYADSDALRYIMDILNILNNTSRTLPPGASQTTCPSKCSSR